MLVTPLREAYICNVRSFWIWALGMGGMDKDEHNFSSPPSEPIGIHKG